MNKSIIYLIIEDMKRNEAWMLRCAELKAWVEVHHHYPQENGRLRNWCRYNIKLRNKGLLDEWKVKLIGEVEALRTHEHTGGRRKSIEDES